LNPYKNKALRITFRQSDHVISKELEPAQPLNGQRHGSRLHTGITLTRPSCSTQSAEVIPERNNERCINRKIGKFANLQIRKN